MYAMPVGVDSFREIIEKKYYFVDKTHFIKELIDNKTKVTLITRPRRFGKTLSMSMLKEFFSINSADSGIFVCLNITKAGEEYMQHRGKYPVIFISLKNVALGGLEYTVGMLYWALSELYEEYSYLLQSDTMSEDDRSYFKKIVSRKITEPNQELAKALHRLCVFLYRHHGVKPIVLIDEYDAPIQYAWENGFYDELIKFMRQFYSAALKSNDALEFAVLTGVLRVAKESIFSGLNNLKVCSVLSDEYSDVFGFTSEEVAGMAADLQCEDKLPELKEWYDGYDFGGTEIYNPWSVIRYFGAKCKPASYWVNTSANEIIKHMLRKLGRKTEQDLRCLMTGGSVFKFMHESIVYDEIGSNAEDFFTILLTTGYLKAIGVQDGLLGQRAELKIPNKEILNLFRAEVLRHMTGYRSSGDVEDMLQSMLVEAAEDFEMNLEQILRNYVSYNDAANGESFYHGMMLGFFVLLNDAYVIESNRESGYGRFDLALLPYDSQQCGVILEFKRAADEAQLEAKAQEALAQIEALSYIAAFDKRGIKCVWKYGIAFCGKRVCLRGNV